MNSKSNESSKAEFIFQNIEQMTNDEIVNEATTSGLDPTGSRQQLMKRLKLHFRKELVESRKKFAKTYRNQRTKIFYDYLIVIDFECTCEENFYDFDNEIIEFPAVLVDVSEKKVKSTFKTLVKPSKKISEFCSKLTGITQAMVDEASTFPNALRKFRMWMRSQGIDTDSKRYAFVTDGPWDIARFFQAECIKHKERLPHDFRIFINLRRAFINRYCKEKDGTTKPGMPQPTICNMLKKLDLEFDGREHCGLDDALNAAKIVIKMLEDNTELRINEKLVLETKMRKWQKEVFQHGSTNDEDQRPNWTKKLSYKLVLINRNQFFGEQYIGCETCDESDEDFDDE